MHPCTLAPRCGVVASETCSVVFFRPASASGLHCRAQFHLPSHLCFLSPLPPLSRRPSRHAGPWSCSNMRSRARLCGPCLAASSRSHYSGELFSVVVAPLRFLHALTNNDSQSEDVTFPSDGCCCGLLPHVLRINSVPCAGKPVVVGSRAACCGPYQPDERDKHCRRPSPVARGNAAAAHAPPRRTVRTGSGAVRPQSPVVVVDAVVSHSS